MPCLLGRGGISKHKKEGDGATPCARMRPQQLFYRRDRLPRPTSTLPTCAIHKYHHWCDNLRSALYNRLVLGEKAKGECLWRNDRRYDLIVTFDYNRHPIRDNAGSAIFLHLIEQGTTATQAATQGCLALHLHDMLTLLPYLRADTQFVFHG